MKRKFALLTLFILSVVACVFGLFGCGADEVTYSLPEEATGDLYVYDVTYSLAVSSGETVSSGEQVMTVSKQQYSVYLNMKIGTLVDWNADTRIFIKTTFENNSWIKTNYNEAYTSRIETETVENGISYIFNYSMPELDTAKEFPIELALTPTGSGTAGLVIEVYTNNDSLTLSGKTFTSLFFNEQNSGVKMSGDTITSVSSNDTVYIPECVTSVSKGVSMSKAIVGSRSAVPSDMFAGVSVEELTIAEGVEAVESDAFKGSSVKNVTIPDSVTTIGDGAFDDCEELKSITVAEDNGAYASYDGILYNKDMTEFVHIPLDLQGDVTIPDGITAIGDEAFIERTSLAGITLGSGVVSVGNSAFYGCSLLESVTLGGAVTSIDTYAFEGCDGLKSVYYGGSLDGWCGISFENNPMYYASALYIDGKIISGDIVLLEGITQIPDGTFKNSDVTSVIIPDGVTDIGEKAFYNCAKLAGITLNNGIEVIGNHAFYGCVLLTELVVPDSVTNIGRLAFYGCSALKSVKVGGGVTSLGGSTFGGCSSLESLTLPFVGAEPAAESASGSSLFGYIFGTKSYSGGTATMQSYGSTDADSTYSETYYIPDSLKSVTITGGSVLCGAFNNCASLTNITLSDDVTGVGDRAFKGCSALTSITLPQSFVSIGREMFYNCTSLTEISIPGGVTSIGANAFSGCKAEIKWGENPAIAVIGTSAFAGYAGKSITIPDGINTIGANAFRACTAEIKWGDDPAITEIGESAFSGYSGKSITIPDGVTEIGENAFKECNSLTSITLPFVGASEDATGYKSVFGYVFGYTTSSDSSSEISGATYQYFESSLYYHYYIPVSLKKVYITIGDATTYAFSNCSSVTDITLSGSGNSVGAYAFWKCTALKSVTVPDSVTSIGSSAFSGCTALKNISLPSATSSLGECAFYGCSLLESVTIPNAVTSIGANAFDGCTAAIEWGKNPAIKTIGSSAFAGYAGTSVTIPDSVTSIGSKAFYKCVALTEINYNATACEDLSDDNEVFYCSGQSGDGITVNIGANVTKIPAYLFGPYNSSYAPKITSVVFAEGSQCESIGNNAFYECTSLENVYYGGTIEDWCGITFSSAYSNPMSYTSHFYIKDDSNEWKEVTEITIPDTITTIGNYQFFGFKNVTSITLNSVETIGYSSFNRCTGLECIVIPDSVTTIGHFAFKGSTSVSSVTIGSGATVIKYSAFWDCTSLTGITVDQNNKNYKSVDGDLYSKDGTTLIQYAVGKTNTSFKIPDGVTTICGSAFCGCSHLESVTIPDNITGIGNEAFYGCTSLTSISMTDSVTEIGDFAFKNCSELTNVTMSSSVTSIGTEAFYGCSQLTSITIPSTVTSIAEDAFPSSTSLVLGTWETADRSVRITDSDGVWDYNIAPETMSLSVLESLGYTKIKIDIVFGCREENDGYQQLWCYYQSSGTQFHSAEFEHDPGHENKNWWNESTSVTVAISNLISSSGTIKFQWGAHGTSEDDWYVGHTYVTYTALKS